MNYLHEHKPEAIIHRDLEPSYVFSPALFVMSILVNNFNFAYEDCSDCRGKV